MVMSKKNLVGALALLITTTAFGCASAPTATQVLTPTAADQHVAQVAPASAHQRTYSTKWIGGYGYGGYGLGCGGYGGYGLGYGGCGGCGYGGYGLGYGGYGYGGCGGYGGYGLGYGGCGGCGY
jgi:hypothetical protein